MRGRDLEAGAEGLGEVLDDLLDADHSHGADGERANERIRIRRVLERANISKTQES